MADIRAFHKAFLDFERLDIGGFDSLNHTSVNDLWFLVLREIDLFDEGEETDIKDARQLNKARRFIAKYGWR